MDDQVKITPSHIAVNVFWSFVKVRVHDPKGKTVTIRIDTPDLSEFSNFQQAFSSVLGSTPVFAFGQASEKAQEQWTEFYSRFLPE